MKMTILHKISYSALFIALGVILSRLVSIPALFGLPFLKVSFAPSIVMFSSFYLGPIFGLIVGTFTDILGAIIFPTGPFNPLYTIAGSLTGLIPYLDYVLINKLKIEDKFPFVGFTITLIFNIGFILFLIFNDAFYSESGKRVYPLEPWLKWTLALTCIFLTALYLFLTYLLEKRFVNRRFNKFYNVNIIASSVFITYFLFKIPVGSLVQSWLLDWNFEIIFITRMLTGFITSFVHIFLISIALDISLFFNVDGVLITRSKGKEASYEEE